MVTCTPPPDGIRHNYPSFIHSPSSSPARTSPGPPLSPIRAAPAQLVKDTSTPSHKSPLSYRGMSPSVYNARPAYHHQDTSPKTAVHIRAGPPLSPIRIIPPSPPSMQHDSLDEEASQATTATSVGSIKATEVSQPAKPEVRRTSWFFAEDPKTESREKADQGALLVKTDDSQPAPKDPRGLADTCPQQENANKTIAGPAKAGDTYSSTEASESRPRAMSLSPRRAAAAEAVDPDNSVASIASLRLQDENSGTQWAEAGPAIKQRDIVDKLADTFAEARMKETEDFLPRQSFGDTMRATFGTDMELENTLEPLRRSTMSPPTKYTNTQPLVPPSPGNLRASTNGKRPRRKDAGERKYKDIVGRTENFSVRTADAKFIRVHKENLLAHTNVLDNINRSAKAIDVSETSDIMNHLIPYCYPSLPYFEMVDVERSNDWELLLGVLVAAEKYGMMQNRGMHHLTGRVRLLLLEINRQKKVDILKLFYYDDSRQLRGWQTDYLHTAAMTLRSASPEIKVSITDGNMKRLLAAAPTCGPARHSLVPTSMRDNLLPLAER